MFEEQETIQERRAKALESILSQHAIAPEEPESRLWLGVIRQAVEDMAAPADRNPEDLPGPANRKLREYAIEERRNKLQATSWLGHPDFRYVCSLLGLDHTWVTRLIARVLDWDPSSFTVELGLHGVGLGSEPVGLPAECV